VLFAPGTIAAEKIVISRLRADPRTPVSRARTGHRPSDRLPWLGLRGIARRSGTGTGGSAAGVSPGRWLSSGIAGWRAFAATDVPPRDTRGYSTEPADAWVETVSRTP
jgi:hypothetical protein